MGDIELFQLGTTAFNDSHGEPETNLDHVEEVMDHVPHEWEAEDMPAFWKIHRRIRRVCCTKVVPDGDLEIRSSTTGWAIFCSHSAISELGIDAKKKREKKPRCTKSPGTGNAPLLRFDPSRF